MAEENKAAMMILRKPQLEERIGLKKSSIHSRLDPKSKYFDPDFPKPIKLSSGCRNGAVGWKSSEIDAWIASRVTATGGQK